MAGRRASRSGHRCDAPLCTEYFPQRCCGLQASRSTSGLPRAPGLAETDRRPLDRRSRCDSCSPRARRSDGARTLSLGRLEIGAFASAPQHYYIARSIDPPGEVHLPPDIRFIFARGPFDEAAERALLKSERIELIVSKNSGGTATYPKIAAARALGIPVVMIARPFKAAGVPVADARGALSWLEALNYPSAPSRRGV